MEVTITMGKTKAKFKLPQLACAEAKEWFDSYDWEDLDQAWACCPRGDWMIWIADWLLLGVEPGFPVLRLCQLWQAPSKHLDRAREAFTKASELGHNGSFFDVKLNPAGECLGCLGAADAVRYALPFDVLVPHLHKLVCE